MATLTTLELLSPPANVVRQAQAKIAQALQKDVANQPMAMWSTSNSTPQSIPVSAGFPQPPVSVSPGFPQPTFGVSPGFPTPPSPAASDTFSDGLADAQVTKRAYEDIRALADSVRSARSSFQMVELMVRDIDRKLRPFIFVPVDNPSGEILTSKWLNIVWVRAGNLC